MIGISDHELIIDNFAGGGGASVGIEQALGRPVDIAINHSPAAIQMHQMNHPDTQHYCEDVWDIDPVKVCKGRPVGLAWFSPDCKHFSIAKGGKPVDKKVRGLAWVAIRWAMKVPVRVFILENVQEFTSWGPCRDRADGKGLEPDPDKMGQTFNAFINVLTTGLSPNTEAWDEAVSELGIENDIAAQEVLKSGLGYAVKYHLRPADELGAPTHRRRFYLVARNDGRPVYWPETTHGNPESLPVRRGVLEPWKTSADCIDWSIPAPSIFERQRPLAEKTLIRIAKGVKKFILDSDEPFIVPSEFSSDRNDHSVRVCAFMARHFGNSVGHQLNEPMATITSGGGGKSALVVAHIMKMRGSNTGFRVDEPLHTVTSGGNHFGLVCSFLLKYYGTNVGCSLDAPLHTITTNDRFALVTVHGQNYQIVDIGMRMLQPHELFSGMGFPNNYIFDRDGDGKRVSKKEQVARCGNAVCPAVSKAYVQANFGLIERKEIAA